MPKLVIATIVLIVAACSGSDGQNAAPSTSPTVASIPVPLTSDLDTSGADVVIGSVELRDVLTFAPEEWEFDSETGAFNPPDDPDTLWRVAQYCEAVCAPLTDSQWLDVVQRLVDERVADREVIRDELTAGRRVVEALGGGDGDRVLVQARWVAGRPKLLLCEVVAGDAVGDAADIVAVMEFACDNTKASLE